MGWVLARKSCSIAATPNLRVWIKRNSQMREINSMLFYLSADKVTRGI